MASKYKVSFFPRGDHPLFPGKKWVGVHRVLMAEKLGRELGRDELVHHRDENPRNNKLSNLELLTRSAHSKHHNTGRTRTQSELDGTSRALKGRPKSAEHIAKMRIAATGRQKTEEELRKLSAATKGVPKSKETVARMKQSWTPERRAAATKRMAERNRRNT